MKFYWTDQPDNDSFNGELTLIRTIRGRPYYLLRCEWPGPFEIVVETKGDGNYITEDGKHWCFYEYWFGSPFDGMSHFTNEKDALSTLDDIEQHPEWFSPKEEEL